jgi:hypothetical protein
MTEERTGERPATLPPFFLLREGIFRAASFYKMETSSAGFRACPLGLVHVSGVGSKGSVAREILIRDSRFPNFLRVVKGKDDAGVFHFGTTSLRSLRPSWVAT